MENYKENGKNIFNKIIKQNEEDKKMNAENTPYYQSIKEIVIENMIEQIKQKRSETANLCNEAHSFFKQLNTDKDTKERYRNRKNAKYKKLTDEEEDSLYKEYNIDDITENEEDEEDDEKMISIDSFNDLDDNNEEDEFFSLDDLDLNSDEEDE